MFTALQLALATTSRYAGVNILSAAAFGMLLWRPSYLFHVGFQLSFLSVAAILLWGIPLYRRLRTPWRAANAAVGMLVVGAVASLDVVWDIADTFNGLMAIPNFIALFALSGVVAKLTTVAPMINFGMPVDSAIHVAASTNRSPPFMIQNRPAPNRTSTKNRLLPVRSSGMDDSSNDCFCRGPQAIGSKILQT